MKIIKIYRGREFEAQVEESIKEDDFFIDEYRKATNLMEEILHSSIKWEDKNNDKDDEKSVIDNHTEYNNNIIAFCGDRGDGKSSAMLTFIRAVAAVKSNDQSELFGSKDTIRKTRFVDRIYVDPSALDDVHNVLDIVVANMFRHFKKECKKKNDNNGIEKREKIIRCFQKVYRALSLKKDSSLILNGEFDNEGNISKLSQLSDTMRLKEYMSELINEYFEYMANNSKNDGKSHNAIIISIDDFDLNISAAYSMAEEIRKYLIIPRIVIVMAVRLRQLVMGIEEYNILQLNNVYNKINRNLIRGEIQEMAEKYISKFIPLAHRVNLPKVQECSDISIEYYENDNTLIKEKDELRDNSVVNHVLNKIYKKTNMILCPTKHGHSLIIPTNIRGVVGLLILLDKMGDPYGLERDNILHENLQLFLDYYYREWIETLPKSNAKESSICAEIKKLIDFDSDFDLHVGSNILLDLINEKYRKSITYDKTKTLNGFTKHSAGGINTICCVMNKIRGMSKKYYMLEVKRYLAAISLLYTIKLNLLSTQKNISNIQMSELVKYGIWGGDFEGVLPRVGNYSEAISRARFSISSEGAYSRIATKLGLEVAKSSSEGTSKFTAKKIEEDSKLRKKQIIAWILFGMFCSNNDRNGGAVSPKMVSSDKLIYDNFAVNTREQVSLENFIIRFCMLDSLYSVLSLDILGVRYDEFDSIIEYIINNNKQMMIISKYIVYNVDVIQEIVEYCARNKDLKIGIGKEPERSKKLTNKFFRNLGEYFNDLGDYIYNIQLDGYITANDLFMFKYGEEDNDFIDITELYAAFIEERLNEENSSATADYKKDIMMKDFLDALDVDKNEQLVNDGYRYFASYIRGTGLDRVQQMVLHMAQNIGVYMRLSGDMEYLNAGMKDKLCKFYDKILTLIGKDATLKVTDDIRREYKELAEVFIPNELEKKISGLQNVRK